jgi:hypothetical protein
MALQLPTQGGSDMRASEENLPEEQNRWSWGKQMVRLPTKRSF